MSWAFLCPPYQSSGSCCLLLSWFFFSSLVILPLYRPHYLMDIDFHRGSVQLSAIPSNISQLKGSSLVHLYYLRFFFFFSQPQKKGKESLKLYSDQKEESLSLPIFFPTQPVPPLIPSPNLPESPPPPPPFRTKLR